MPGKPVLLVFHGTLGSPDINWFRWLEREMRGIYDVYVPKLPTPEGQTVEDWWAAVWEQVPLTVLAGDIVLVGHSCGGLFLPYVLERLERPVLGSVLVAPVTGPVGHEVYDQLNQTFYEHEFAWEEICHKAGDVHVLAGEHDPYVPREQFELAARELGVPVTWIADGGHLNGEFGFVEFPLVAEIVRNMVGRNN